MLGACTSDVAGDSRVGEPGRQRGLRADRSGAMKGTLSSVDNGTYACTKLPWLRAPRSASTSRPRERFLVSPGKASSRPTSSSCSARIIQQVQQAIRSRKPRSRRVEQQGGTTTRRRRGPVYVETAGMVFSQSGHMRSFHGVAYIPQLVPQGVQASDIR